MEFLNRLSEVEEEIYEMRSFFKESGMLNSETAKSELKKLYAEKKELIQKISHAF